MVIDDGVLTKLLNSHPSITVDWVESFMHLKWSKLSQSSFLYIKRNKSVNEKVCAILSDAEYAAEYDDVVDNGVSNIEG